MSFDSFVLKVASRCNLNCSYCYVYNQGDSSWKAQPRLMSAPVARMTAMRIYDHALAHHLSDVVINFHGGEPLLGGTRHLRSVYSEIADVFSNGDVRFSTAIQSNGLRFTSEIGDMLKELEIGLYISMDGPPGLDDQRVDLRGDPTGSRLEKKMSEITSPEYRRLFSGFLSVVHPESDPAQVFNYLAAFNPPLIDFLLPLKNHDRPPEYPISSYGDWLCTCFDHWLESGTTIRVRTFDDIILGITGARGDDSNSEYLIIETDGSIELDDTLKTAYPGAAKLGLSVFQQDLDIVSRMPRVAAMRNDIALLSTKCKSCPLVTICRGGHVSHRYSTKNNLDNPSVYCTALQELILHVWQRLSKEVKARRQEPTKSA